MNQASILTIITVAIMLCGFGYFIHHQRIKSEIASWDRGLNRDVCLPSPVACGTLEQGRQASQCDLIQDTIQIENQKAHRQLKGSFPNFKAPRSIFHFTTKPASVTKPIFVHAATIPQLSDGGLCNLDTPITGKLGTTSRQPLFGAYTKAIHVTVCFNKYRAVKRGKSNASLDNRTITKRMKDHGVKITIAHHLHHAWIGQTLKTSNGHPSASCELMCTIPKGPRLATITLALMRRVIEQCRMRPPDI